MFSRLDFFLNDKFQTSEGVAYNLIDLNNPKERNPEKGEMMAQAGDRADPIKEPIWSLMESCDLIGSLSLCTDITSTPSMQCCIDFVIPIRH